MTKNTLILLPHAIQCADIIILKWFCAMETHATASSIPTCRPSENKTIVTTEEQTSTCKPMELKKKLHYRAVYILNEYIYSTCKPCT